MFDSVQTQKDLTGLLLSEETLLSVQIKSHRKMVIENELNYLTILTTPRNGRSGAAALVLQPSASAPRPGVTGPVLDWTFPIVVIEMPPINLVPQTGTLISAEDLAQRVMDCVHKYSDTHAGTFEIQATALAVETQYVFKGCVSYRVNFHITGRSLQRPRLNVLTVTWDGINVTITSPDADIELRYTTDGSFPGRDTADNPASKKYEGPFSSTSGTAVRAMAFKKGYNNSPCQYLQVP